MVLAVGRRLVQTLTAKRRPHMAICGSGGRFGHHRPSVVPRRAATDREIPFQFVREAGSDLDRLLAATRDRREGRGYAPFIAHVVHRFDTGVGSRNGVANW